MTASLFIDGVWRVGAGATLVSTDPATGAAVWEGACADAGDVAAAVAAARRAFQPWADLPLEDRVAALRRYRSALEARADAMAQDFSRETGKPLWETRAEIASMMAKIEVSITAQAERAGERAAATAFGQAVLRHRPHRSTFRATCLTATSSPRSWPATRWCSNPRKRPRSPRNG
jgi:succinylglutamic semialdehyde dehydrogenase